MLSCISDAILCLWGVTSWQSVDDFLAEYHAGGSLHGLIQRRSACGCGLFLIKLTSTRWAAKWYMFPSLARIDDGR
jgi:hypothetical protein